MTATNGGVLLVGCGKMGAALLAGWRERGASGPFTVVEPAAAATAPLRGKPGVDIHADAALLPDGLRPDVVMFAVKPQVMEAIVPAYRRFVGALFLSIAAGRTIGFFERLLGAEAAIVRAMPNTPAAVGHGITVLCANARTDAAQRARAESLLTAVGETAWLDDERHMDAVTALSGSGPAYVFLLAECMEAGGVAAGLDPGLAARLARATVAGAGEMLHATTETPEILRKNVTSPGGTTAAALEVLRGADGMGPLLERAIAAAARRSRELAG